MNKEYKIKLDLNKKLYNKKMAFNQFDENVNDFYIEVTKNNKVVKDLDKSIITLVAIKPNGEVDAQFIEVKEGQIYADLKPSMCDLVGNYQAKAMIVLEGEIVTTDTINYSVNEDKIISKLNDDVVSDERFTLFTDALARLSTIELSEEQRQINEAERILSEENRKIEEAKRVEAELIRQHEEADRTKYDAIRESNENIRKQNESIRLSNETNRIDEEAKRVEEENKRKLAEEERNANYNFMTEDEERRRSEANAHKEAEVLRVQAETDRVNEEAKRRTTEQGRVLAENARDNNENTREANEVTRKNNEIQRIEAETQRQSRYNSFISDAEANANNFENYTNTAKVKEEERKSNELDRKSQEDRRVSNEVERISNEETRKANEVVREENETSRQNVFKNKVDEVDKKIVELNTTKDNFVSSVNTKVDNKISEIEVAKSDITTTVSNKIDEVENRFNALTSKQQQDAEVIDARDGETSLKARLDRDIEKAKQVYVNIEGSYISTDSSVGYAKDVEILGNTIQSASNLADIRSVGDKVEGQELYEIPVLSCGKNLFDKTRVEKYKNLHENTGNTIDEPNGAVSDFIKLSKNKSYICNNPWAYHTHIYDMNKKWVKRVGLNKITAEDDCYVRIGFDITKVDEIQLEEGTVATPYEPYVEDKLTILSPVQLEKVGDVADRIIEKDGVWGVEKNIKTFHYNGGENWQSLGGSNGAYRYYLIQNDILFIERKQTVLSNKYNYNPIAVDGYNIGIQQYSNNKLAIVCDIASFSEFKDSLKDGLLVKAVVTQPQFIPLPHSQQVKLRTFANKTNISFLTEIEGTIKAQVPKSIGATVNTHTEQINNLNNELNRVKKLEESTVSTVTTESDFTTVEATSNGYFEDVKLEGKTLVNLCDSISTRTAGRIYNLNIIQNLKENVRYLLQIDSVVTNYDGILCAEITYNDGTTNASYYFNDVNLKTGIQNIEFTPIKEITNLVLKIRATDYDKGSRFVLNKVLLLEGDHTQNPPSFFEGLASVGQSASEDGTDEIVVSSVNENLFSFDKNKPIDLIEGYCQSIPVYSSGRVYFKGSSYNADNLADYRNGYININCNNFAFESNTNYKVSVKLDIVRNPLNANIIHGYPRATNHFVLTLNPKTNRYEGVIPSTQYLSTSENIKSRIEFRVAGIEGYISEIMIQKYGGESTTYTPHQSDKKRLLYYNNETQAWEKPILREWDSIEKHADGKYYYHQRSGEVVLNGSEDWRVSSSVDANSLYYVDYGKIASLFKENSSLICDKLSIRKDTSSDRISNATTNHGIMLTGTKSIRIKNSSCSSLDSFKQWLQANNVTVVYQLAQEKVYECTNIDLITYANETNYMVNCGAIVPKTTLKVHNNISNVVSLLQKKVSLLESNVKASQEVQDMMILETDMRMLDIELALMDFIPMTLNLGGSNMLRSATYFNFLKNHIINETYEKEYLENVMNKYLATGRINQDEYNELYKMLYPPVYDIELPIEY